MPKTTKADLEADNARLRRENGALLAWFHCANNPRKYPEHGLTVDAPDIGDVTLCLTVLGMQAPHGGVVTVWQEGVGSTAPEYLDALLSRWEHSVSPYLREAASKLRKAQTEAVRARVGA